MLYLLVNSERTNRKVCPPTKETGETSLGVRNPPSFPQGRILTGVYFILFF
jgi:hypothetical protein